MDEMDDYSKYIEWTGLSDKSTMIYCQKEYCKPVNEIKLLAHIKRTIMTTIEQQ